MARVVLPVPPFPRYRRDRVHGVHYTAASIPLPSKRQLELLLLRGEVSFRISFQPLPQDLWVRSQFLFSAVGFSLADA